LQAVADNKKVNASAVVNIFFTIVISPFNNKKPQHPPRLQDILTGETEYKP
jgi:hypothetical protein